MSKVIELSPRTQLLMKELQAPPKPNVTISHRGNGIITIKKLEGLLSNPTGLNGATITFRREEQLDIKTLNALPRTCFVQIDGYREVIPAACLQDYVEDWKLKEIPDYIQRREIYGQWQKYKSRTSLDLAVEFVRKDMSPTLMEKPLSKAFLAVAIGATFVTASAVTLFMMAPK